MPGRSDRLARLLDTPHLAELVPRLAPEALYQLIRHRGLEACGALVAAATPGQLASVLDADLWLPTQGGDDRFDERRFGMWIETLVEEGEAVAARIVATMDRGLVVAGLSRYVRVFDPAVLTPPAGGDDDEGSDAPSSAPLEADIGGYVVRARTAQVWDAIVGLLGALADEQPPCFHALMHGCRRLSNSVPEIDGLDDLMLEPEQLLHDVAAARESRRSRQGYVTAADARAFLQMARQPRAREPLASLHDAAMTSAPPGARLVPVAGPAGGLTPLQALLESLHETDEAAYFARSSELAFLANALVAGCSVHDRPFTADEARNAAAGVCNLGLELSLARSGGPHADAAGNLHDLLTAFEAGWRLLYEDVSMFVADRLISTLGTLRIIDPALDSDLRALRRELERHRSAGAPWRARDALDVIGMLDMPAWACLRGLLSECPVLPAAMTAVLEGRTGAVSASDFECFATTGQIRRVHRFAETLGDMLLR